MADKLEVRGDSRNRYSPHCDFIYYESSRNPGLMLAMRILKPEGRSYILADTHGWHMDIPDFELMDKPASKYLSIQVEMRGRVHSDGKPDCNGWELYDVIDAVNFVREHYSKYIIDKEIVYFEGGSGGGGNAYSIIGKFPDFFAAATVQCGISDYEMWYRNDEVGEFKDEMDIWIGKNPEENSMAYQARSGITLLENLLTPLFIAHGDKDLRVPVEQARIYVQRARVLGKDSLISYLELKGVDHWGNITNEQIDLFNQLSEKNRTSHRNPVEIPEKGRTIIAGYLFTKKFSIVLDSIDKVAILDYDINNCKFEIQYR